LAWQWFHLVGMSAALLGAYVAVLAALREFRKEDLRLFLDLLDPRKMARYIHGELTTKEIE
ncbi:MAG: flippase, partial [Thermoplasmata archaeon]